MYRYTQNWRELTRVYSKIYIPIHHYRYTQNSREMTGVFKNKHTHSSKILKKLSYNFYYFFQKKCVTERL